jgi:hypothetical protein
MTWKNILQMCRISCNESSNPIKPIVLNFALR